MENEIRYYLKHLKKAINEEELPEFNPQYLIAAVRLDTGAVELSINTTEIEEKIDYILEAYDEDMRLKTNSSISIESIMIV